MEIEINEKKVRVDIIPRGDEVDIDKASFGLALKMFRLRNNLTQKQLGERWGLSRYTILRAEKGVNLTWESAYRLFSRLSVELAKEQPAATAQSIN